jgi:uncharacterized phage protein (TIGR01671 family)
MNDRFLFRGKRKIGACTGNWIGGYLHYDDDGYFIGDQNTLPCMYTVDPDTICQSTGLRDKNGWLIFEHDILEARLDKRFPEEVTRTEVIWTGFCWALKYHECDPDVMDESDEKIWEVVGNTIDNPELLV